MKEKKEKKAARGKQYVEEAKIFNQKKQAQKALLTTDQSGSSGIISRIQPNSQKKQEIAKQSMGKKNDAKESQPINTESDDE